MPDSMSTHYCYVCRSQRFLGGRQQDSHEVLRHLMDAVKDEHKMLKEHLVVCRFGLDANSSESQTMVYSVVYGCTHIVQL